MGLRILSYNVRYFGHALRGAGSTRGAVEAIAGAIAGLPDSPDVICLQEVETRSLRSRLSLPNGKPEHTQLDVFMSALDQALERCNRKVRYRGVYFPAHEYRVRKTNVFTTGLAILYSNRVTLDDHNANAPHEITHRRLSQVARWKQSRICAHVRIVPPSGGPLDVFNTHLSLPSWATKRFFNKDPNLGYADNQVREIEALAAFVDRERASDRFVIVGDFNALSGSPAYARLLEKGTVVDPVPELTGHSPLDLRTRWPTAGFLNLRMRLDHIFVGPALRALDLDDCHPFGVEGRWHGLSDHVPILSRLESS